MGVEFKVEEVRVQEFVKVPSVVPPHEMTCVHDAVHDPEESTEDVVTPSSKTPANPHVKPQTHLNRSF